VLYNKRDQSLPLTQRSDNAQEKISGYIPVDSLEAGANKRNLILGCTFGLLAVAPITSLAPLVIESHPTTATVLSTAVSWIYALGIIVSAILNGFGSVSMPHNCLAGLYLEPIHPDAIA
jgi:hypothetical protein